MTPPRLPFIGKFDYPTEVRPLAEDICRTIGLDHNLRREASSWAEFLGGLIEQVESNRILVLRSGVVKLDTTRKLSVDEFRGFVITDPIAPLIFLNGRDAQAAQIFTLAHELVHLWLGQSGVSNPDLGKPEISPDQEIERFCNLVAAQMLVPAEAFNSEWLPSRTLEENVNILVRFYKVSSLVVLRRAFDLRRIGWSEYRTAYVQEVERFRSRDLRNQKSGGGNFYATLETRNGRELTKAVVLETLEGRLPYRDAARLLGVKSNKIEALASIIGIK